MKYLLDTCAISESNKKVPNAGFLDFMQSHRSSEFFLSVVSVGEICNGIGLLAANDSRKNALAYWLEGLNRSFEDRIVPVDLRVAMLWGNLSASQKKLGRILPMADGLIAATAMVQQFTVVTRNTQDFSETGVSILDPWT